jgi:hypothetical protein
LSLFFVAFRSRKELLFDFKSKKKIILNYLRDLRAVFLRGLCGKKNIEHAFYHREHQEKPHRGHKKFRKLRGLCAVFLGGLSGKKKNDLTKTRPQLSPISVKCNSKKIPLPDTSIFKPLIFKPKKFNLQNFFDYLSLSINAF